MKLQVIHIHSIFNVFIMANTALKCSGKIFIDHCNVHNFVHVIIIIETYVILPSGDMLHPTAFTFVSCMHNINGSQLNGGCPASWVISIMLCQCSDRNSSGLHIDGIIPDIDTSNTGSWENQLFAICSHYSIVPIGFQFHETVQITSVELNLFICYQWNIPFLQFNVTISTSASYIIPIDEIILGELMVNLSQSNCNSLMRFVINLKNIQSPSRN